MRILFSILACFLLFSVSAQTRSPRTATPKGKTVKGKPVKPVADTVAQADPAPSDTLDPRDTSIKASRKFAVYTKRPRGVDKRKKLCFQLTGDTIFNHCVKDSTLRDPEVYRELFRRKDGDTTYVLLFVDAFTKEVDKLCDGGHETKLVFFKWNTKRNKAVIRQRTISSCVKAINNMSKVDFDSWDKNSPLVFEYNRGVNFYEITFDPARYKQGFITDKIGDEEDGQ